MTTKIYFPEDLIVTQGEPSEKLFFLAIGHLEVWIADEHKNQHMI